MLTEQFCTSMSTSVFWTSMGYWPKKRQSNSFSIWLIILFVCKAQLLFLQEIQEVNTKTKEQPHGILLTTSFFHKEIVTYLQHIYTLGDKSSQKLIFNSIALEP